MLLEDKLFDFHRFLLSILFFLTISALNADDIDSVIEDYQSLLNVKLDNSSSIEEIKNAYDSFNNFFIDNFDETRFCASTMGKEYFIKASTDQRASYSQICELSVAMTMSEVSIMFRDYQIKKTNTINENNLKRVNFNLIKGSRNVPVTFTFRNSDLVNVVFNNVNIGLTYRNQFEALYEFHDGDIEEVINRFITEPTFKMATAESNGNELVSKSLKFFGEVLIDVIEKYPEAKRNAQLRQNAYNKGVQDARRRCNNSQNLMC